MQFKMQCYLVIQIQILNHFCVTNINILQVNVKSKKNNFFLKSFQSKWKTVYRTKSVFLTRYQSWLDQTIFIYNQPSSSGGCPKIEFDTACGRTKHRKTSDLVALSPNS